MTGQPYTDADVKVAQQTWINSGSDLLGSVREVLDAVAPAIAARALREAAESVDLDLGDGYGMTTDSWATSTAARWLRDRADEIATAGGAS